MRTRSKMLITLVIAFVMSLAMAAIGLTAFAAPSARYSEQFGTWSGDEKSLTADSLIPVNQTNPKAIVVDSALNTSESFTLSFKTVIPAADTDDVGSVGFFARASAGGAGKVDNPMSGFMVEIFRTNFRLVYNTAPGALQVAWGSPVQHGAKTGDVVTVEVSVKGDIVNAKLKNAEGTLLTEASCVSGIAYSETTYAGFSVEKTNAFTAEQNAAYQGKYAAFSDITYQAAESPEEPEDPTADIKPVNELNANFATTAGGFKGDAEDKHVVTSEFHPQMNSSVMISGFGGVYGENFDVTYKVKSPSRKEIDGAGGNDPNAGFFFRQRTSWDLYSGIYVRIQKDQILIVNDLNNTDADQTIPSLVSGKFKEALAPSSFLTVHINVQDDVITVDVKDADGNPVVLVNDAKEDVTSLSVKARNSYDPTHVAGFAGEHMTAIFSDIKMTAGDKEFMAYPFDPDKTMDLADLEIGGNGMTLVELVKGGEGIQPDDEELIGQFPFILYAEYDMQVHDVTAKLAGGQELPAGMSAKFEYRVAPTWEYVPWVAQQNAGRHGMAVSIMGEDGYVYARVIFAYKIYAKNVTLTGVTATDKTYDGSTEVALTGGTLSGVIEGDKVGFELGVGIANQSGVGQNIPVTVSTAVLTGESAANYSLSQPEGITVNITKGKAETPESVFIEDKTETSITVEAIYGAEYSIDGVNWQDSNVFEGLKTGTEYTVRVRMKASDNQEASDAVETVVKTNGSADKGGCGSTVAASTTVAAFAVLAVAAAAVAFARKERN